MTVRFDFHGKTALVTGASRGIGFEVARRFAEAGARVFALARQEGIEEVARRIAEETGADVRAVRCDVAERAAVAEAVGGIDRIDILVNNAGLERPTPMAEQGSGVEDLFDRIMEVNVGGTYAVTRQALERMGAGGRVILSSSIWGKTAVAGFSAYCASKHALIGLVRVWAKELGPRGMTVNAVCPGWVETDSSLRTLGVMAAERRVSPESLLEEIVAAQAIGGLMRPVDVAGVYLFLASSAAADITGQVINVDRGEVMW